MPTARAANRSISFPGWAVNTGAHRAHPSSLADLATCAKVGVSRLGSGSHIMSYVLAEEEGIQSGSQGSKVQGGEGTAQTAGENGGEVKGEGQKGENSHGGSAAGTNPFEPVVLHNFAQLRQAVNEDVADFFMWEYYTSKRYYAASPGSRDGRAMASTPSQPSGSTDDARANDNDVDLIKALHKIPSPWPSWLITASTSLLLCYSPSASSASTPNPQAPASSTTASASDPRLEELFSTLDAAISYFWSHQKETMDYLTMELDYDANDAREWWREVTFACPSVKGVDTAVVEQTMEVLRRVGVVGGEDGMAAAEMVAFETKK